MLTWNEQIFAPRRHDHLLVIPVINEGERIRRQLERIAAAAPEIDIVIADGGSTDGSLDAATLARLGVRALLTKTSDGKLSAQLRMAYGWALDQGYAGIVTMDGNDKDGVEAIALFVEKLRQGYDYVQGSRYLEGGAAINTPLDRKLAGRLLHAPLLSFGAHRSLSDTTNGFRAYSRAYLTDPRTAPFRETFKVYNLLFYLTVRAGALGYRVAQVPVTRAYPAGEKVPTKIAGIGSRLALLGETLNAATGAYSPPSGPPQHLFPAARRTAVAIAVLIALLLAGFAALFSHHMALSPDSWSQYELARSIPSDFYRLHVRRGFWSEPAYSAAFPPLWPAILYLVDCMARLGAASGFYSAWLAFALFVAASELAGRRFFETRWAGAAAGLLLLAHPGLLDEIAGGRTIPLQLMLYAACAWAIARPKIGLANAAGLGLAAGLALMNRFDAMPFVVALALVVLLQAQKRVLVLAYAGACLIVASPWIVYSRERFGRWFVTDNGPIAMSPDPKAFVTDWWPAPPPTAMDLPLHWIGKVAINAARMVPALLESFASQPLWILPLLAAWGCVRLAGQSAKEADPGKARPVMERRLIGFSAALCAILPSYALTGYFDARYFAPQIWLALFALFGWLSRRLANGEQRDLFGLSWLALAIATTAIGVAAQASSMPRADGAAFPRDPGDAALGRCLDSSSRPPVLLSADDIQASRLSAVYGWNTVLLPRNFARLQPEATKAFVKQFAITHVYASGQGQWEEIGSKLRLETAPNCPAVVKGVQQ
jgi:hypothetical protein